MTASRKNKEKKEIKNIDKKNQVVVVSPQLKTD